MVYIQCLFIAYCTIFIPHHYVFIPCFLYVAVRDVVDGVHDYGVEVLCVPSCSQQPSLLGPSLLLLLLRLSGNADIMDDARYIRSL